MTRFDLNQIASVSAAFVVAVTATTMLFAATVVPAAAVVVGVA